MFCRMRCAGRCEVPRPWVTVPPEGMNRLYYIHSGTGGVLRDGRKIPFQAGKLYLLPAFSRLETYTDPSDRLVHTYVNFELVPPILSSEIPELDPSADDVTYAAFCLFDRLAGRKAEQQLSSEEVRLLEGTVEYLALQAAEQAGAMVLADKTVNCALEIMNRRMGERLTVSDIAAECYMSTDGFIRKFTRAVGMTPYAYFKNLRLRAAAALRESGATAAEAAEKCGYSDAAALLHAMKRRG